MSNYILGHIRRHHELMKGKRFQLPKNKRLQIEKINPFLGSQPLLCLIGTDGIVMYVEEDNLDYAWHIAGGPALMVDYEDTQTPTWVVQMLKDHDIFGEPIGIYRIVGERNLISKYWTSHPLASIASFTKKVNGKPVTFLYFEETWIELLAYLTFGAFGGILSIYQFASDQGHDDPWNKFDLHNMGFLTADRQNRRFLKYLKVIPSIDVGMLDTRLCAHRVNMELKNWASDRMNNNGGMLTFDPIGVDLLADTKIHLIGEIIDEVEDKILHDPMIMESEIHSTFKKYPFLLEPCGELHSKVRFKYPEGESPLDKDYIEPDFIIKLPNFSYIVVEIEKPQKPLQTQSGNPSFHYTQAHFQTVEFRDYIDRHYRLLTQEFPGIDVNAEYWLVIGRNGQDDEKLSGRRRLLKRASKADKVFTFDELFERVRDWYRKLQQYT